jgi:Tfp pilus assembly protein FimT
VLPVYPQIVVGWALAQQGIDKVGSRLNLHFNLNSAVESTASRYCTKSSSRGFTFLELMSYLVILTLFLTCSTSVGVSFYKKNQQRIIAEEIKAAIHFAQLQAVSTGQSLVLTPLDARNDWSNGMLLFMDNPKHHYDSESKLIHKWQWFAKPVHVTWQGFQSKRYLLFTPTINNNTVNGYFMIHAALCNDIKLTINRIGRIKESRLT